VLWDYQTNWALEIQSNAPEFALRSLADDIDRALRRLGATADAVGPQSDLARYKIVIAPTLHLAAPATVEALKKYVEAGGTLVLGPRSGVKDEENAVVGEHLPGLLRPMAGCRVTDYDSFGMQKHEVFVEDGAGAKHAARFIADVLEPEGGAKILWRYANRFYKGRAAAVEHSFGRGRVYYLGTMLDEAGLGAFLKPAAIAAGLTAREELPESVEAVTRVKAGKAYTFYLNNKAEAVRIRLRRAGRDILSGKTVRGETEVAGLELLIVEEN
jgi:beta-galactosidase